MLINKDVEVLAKKLYEDVATSEDWKWEDNLPKDAMLKKNCKLIAQYFLEAIKETKSGCPSSASHVYTWGWIDGFNKLEEKLVGK